MLTRFHKNPRRDKPERSFACPACPEPLGRLPSPPWPVGQPVLWPGTGDRLNSEDYKLDAVQLALVIFSDEGPGDVVQLVLVRGPALVIPGLSASLPRTSCSLP